MNATTLGGIFAAVLADGGHTARGSSWEIVELGGGANALRIPVDYDNGTEVYPVDVVMYEDGNDQAPRHPFADVDVTITPRDWFTNPKFADDQVAELVGGRTVAVGDVLRTVDEMLVETAYAWPGGW